MKKLRLLLCTLVCCTFASVSTMQKHDSEITYTIVNQTNNPIYVIIGRFDSKNVLKSSSERKFEKIEATAEKGYIIGTSPDAVERMTTTTKVFVSTNDKLNNEIVYPSLSLPKGYTFYSAKKPQRLRGICSGDVTFTVESKPTKRDPKKLEISVKSNLTCTPFAETRKKIKGMWNKTKEKAKNIFKPKPSPYPEEFYEL